MNVITSIPGSNKVKLNKKITKKHYHELKDKAKILLRKAIKSAGGIEEMLWGLSLDKDLEKLEKIYNDRKVKNDAMMKQQEDELALFLDEEDVTLIWTEIMISRVLKNTKFSIGNFTKNSRDSIYADTNQYIPDENNPESNDNIHKSIGLSVTGPNSISNSPDFNNSINIKDFKKFMSQRDKKRRASSIIRAVKNDEKREVIKVNENDNDNNNNDNDKLCINDDASNPNNNNDKNITTYSDDKSDTDSSYSEIGMRKSKSKIVTKETNRNLTGVDIVADLFSMSNELRIEREQISLNSSQDTALNRKTTLKYAAVLEEVVQSKEESERARRRAALLRMQKNAMKYNNVGKSDTSVFLMFWQNVQKLQNVNTVEAVVSTVQSADTDKVNANLAKSVLEAQIKTLFKAKLLLNEKMISNGTNSSDNKGLTFDQTSYQKIYGTEHSSTDGGKSRGHSKSNSFSISITNKGESSKNMMNYNLNYSDVKSRHMLIDEEENNKARKRRRELAKLIRLAAGSKREKKAVDRLIDQMPEVLRAEFQARVEAKREAMKDAIRAAAINSKVESLYDDSDDDYNKDTIRQGIFLTQKVMDIETGNDGDDEIEVIMSPRIKARYSLYGEGTIYSGSLLPMTSPNMGLSGRWGYDVNIDEGPVEPLYISGGVNRDQPTFYPNLPRNLEVFPMQSRGLDIDEVSFDQDTFFVNVKMIREGFVLRDMSVHINDIYVTQSRFTDMVSLRSASQADSGYIGTIQHSAWANVVKSIDTAIDNAITKSIKAKNHYTGKVDPDNSSMIDANVSASPNPRPARLVLDDFFLTSSEYPNSIEVNGQSTLLQNTFPFSSDGHNGHNASGINESIVSLPNIYASIDMSSPKAMQKTVGMKTNRIYNQNAKSMVYDNILSTSTLYSDEHTKVANNTPRRPESNTANAKISKLRKVAIKLATTNNDDDENNNNNNENENENGVNIDNNIVSGYAALGDSIEFLIGGNQPPTVTRVVTKDIRSPCRKSFRKRQTELIAEATIEANKGKIKNSKAIHKVYDMTKSMRSSDNDLEKELANKAKEINNDNTTKVVMLVETERLLHLYFAKKFLSLDIMIDPVLTIYDALEAIKHNPRQYGLILVSYSQLVASGDIRRSLMSILPIEVNENDYSIIVYGDVFPDDDTLSIFEQCGVADVLDEPYTADKIKNIFLAHQSKLSMTK